MIPLALSLALAVPLPAREPLPVGAEVRAVTLRYTVLAYLPDTPHGRRYRVRQYRLDPDGTRTDVEETTVAADYLEGHFYEGWHR